ncbi:hypothetical protein RI054_35g135420 [Pseudoscourfieldia marina]
MTNYKYAELFAANVHERHRASPLNWLLIWTPTTTTRSSYPTSSVAPTNARPYTIVSYAQIQKTADAALHYPCKGAAVAVTAAARVAEEAATPNVSTRSDTTDAPKCKPSAPHTHDTPMCYAPGGARHDPARWRGNTDAGRGGRGGRGGYQGGRGGRGGRHPLQYTPQPQHYTPRNTKTSNSLEARAVSSATTTVAIAAHANNIARVGEAFPTMNAPPPTGQMYQTGPYRRTFAITLATNEPNCSKYIVDNASPYTLTGSLNHLYDVQQLEKPKEIGGIKKDSTIKCTHVGKIDFTTHEGTLTASNAYYGFYFGQIDVETAYLYALVQELIYMRPPKGTNYGPNKIAD